MSAVGKSTALTPSCAAIFGASGGIGRAMAIELRERGCARIHAGSRSGTSPAEGMRGFRFDLRDEASIAASAQSMRDDPPDCVLIASGVLSLESARGPERSYKRLDPGDMAEALALNTIGPALIAKHMLPLLKRDQRSVFAALSARVGSISDNRLGGWHSYRASKAALNMLLKNWAIELARTHPQAIVLGLHPGTVDTALSAPFQKGLPPGQLMSPQQSARHLVDVMGRAGAAHSGQVLDWKGEVVPV